MFSNISWFDKKNHENLTMVVYSKCILNSMSQNHMKVQIYFRK
jgi:hypothetical protein